MANGEKNRKREEKEMKASKIGIPFAAFGVIILVVFMPVVNAQEGGPGEFGCPPDWDKSSLRLTGACYPSDGQVMGEVCNVGDGDMAGPSTFEVWYKETGNPKDGVAVFTAGVVPALASGECTILSYALSPCLAGNYLFRVLQRPGHPGAGELWSESCSITCPPPLCEETKPPEYGEWTPWSEWTDCVNGEQSHSRSREVIVYDKYREDYVCDQWTDPDSESRWCDLCEETKLVYGEWTPYGEWTDCADGWKTRTRTRVVQKVDINHPTHVCKEWVEPDVQEEPCDYCTVTKLVYGEWTPYGEWTDCVDGIRSRTRTRDVWEVDVLHPGYECGHIIEPDVQEEPCLPGICEVVDKHEIRSCTPLGECIDGVQLFECQVETWTTDYFRPEVVCGRTSSVVIEERPCEVPEDKTSAGQVELIFSCPVLEAYDPINWNFNDNVPTGESLYDVPGPSGPDQTKIHPRGGYWKYAESVSTMIANGRLDPYGEYWALLTCWSVDGSWRVVGLVRPMYYQEDLYPTYPIRWWVEAWADESQTPASFDHQWYQVIRPQDFHLVGLK